MVISSASPTFALSFHNMTSKWSSAQAAKLGVIRQIEKKNTKDLMYHFIGQCVLKSIAFMLKSLYS